MNIFDEAILVLYKQGFSIGEISYLLNIDIEDVELSLFSFMLV